MIALSTRAAVADALRRAGGVGVSGEAIASALGISRATVNAHVAALRSLGYEIASSSRVGYRLVSAPDACLPEQVAPRLRDHLWVSCAGGAETVSTNDDAKRLARAGAPEGALVVAARQTGGRGRFDRAWVSPDGGAYVSCVLRPPLPPTAIAPLPLVAAVGVADGLAGLGLDTRLKWPNDVEVGGRKLAGILLEMAAEADRTEWVVLGCGLNVTGHPHERAASVADHVPGVSVVAAAAAVLDGIAGAYRRFVAGGFGAVRGSYVRRLGIAGQTVVVRDAAGSVVAEGPVAGIGEAGELLVGAPGNELRVVAGEVTLRD
ncbi:MAG: biotin--[acetyl-CoA-carboxylase] ligase [Coriobacteriia bacterium]|nr:biotin--[acetyl-CoA-carboxylase] ligase [Coriobacteriia bacterium]